MPHSEIIEKHIAYAMHEYQVFMWNLTSSSLIFTHIFSPCRVFTTLTYSVTKNMEKCGGELNDKQVKEVSAGDIWRSEVSLFPFVIQDL